MAHLLCFHYLVSLLEPTGFLTQSLPNWTSLNRKAIEQGEWRLWFSLVIGEWIQKKERNEPVIKRTRKSNTKGASGEGVVLPRHEDVRIWGYLDLRRQDRPGRASRTNSFLEKRSEQAGFWWSLGRSDPIKAEVMMLMRIETHCLHNKSPGYGSQLWRMGDSSSPKYMKAFLTNVEYIYGFVSSCSWWCWIPLAGHWFCSLW